MGDLTKKVIETFFLGILGISMTVFPGRGWCREYRECTRDTVIEKIVTSAANNPLYPLTTGVGGIIVCAGALSLKELIRGDYRRYNLSGEKE